MRSIWFIILTMDSSRIPFDGNDLLYRSLLILIICSYSVPVMFGINSIFYEAEFATRMMLNLAITAALIATIKPVWTWSEPRVHQLIYAMDATQLEMIGQVSDSLTSTSQADSLLTAVADTIARTVNLPFVELETINGSIARFGENSGRTETVTIDVKYHDDIVGWLRVLSRSPIVPLSRGEISLLNSLARQVGITLHATQLQEALQTSREQLVTSRAEERLRIRRDLHDGLGPTLASMRMQLGAVRRLIRTDPETAERFIDELREDVSGATAEIRHLVYALRPPMLDDLGLIESIRNFKVDDASLQLEIVVPETLPHLSAALEVAVYRIANEAIHNVIKHAGATHCTIAIEAVSGHLDLNITDDGRAPAGGYLPGIGLNSMKERASELGGTFSIRPLDTGGTHIAARFPLESN